LQADTISAVSGNNAQNDGVLEMVCVIVSGASISELKFGDDCSQRRAKIRIGRG